jgi:Ras-related protein Rab-11A
MNRIKIILAGESLVGKTSLIKQYTQKEFLEDNVITTSADKTTKTIETKNNTKYTLEIWDTAGNKAYKATNKIFMRNTQIAILVYDITKKESFDELENSYNQILNSNNNNNIVFAVAGNKSDLYEEQIIFPEKGIQFANKINAIFKETSAKDYESVNELFEDVIEKYDLMMIENKNKNNGDDEENKSVSLSQTKVNEEKKSCC